MLGSSCKLVWGPNNGLVVSSSRVPVTPYTRQILSAINEIVPDDNHSATHPVFFYGLPDLAVSHVVNPDSDLIPTYGTLRTLMEVTSFTYENRGAEVGFLITNLRAEDISNYLDTHGIDYQPCETQIILNKDFFS